jgi:hypothetical protein
MTTKWLACAAFLVLAACGSDVSLDGADGAFITGNVGLEEDCTTSADAPLLQSGEYDIAEAGESNSQDSTPCRNPYVMRLVTEIEANQIALFDQATVTLLTLNEDTLVFGDLPNPFKLATAGSVRPKGDTPKRGVVEVAAIAPVYASQLGEFADFQVRVEVQLEGFLEDGSTVRTQVFSYPVNICKKCLDVCRTADILLGMEGVIPEDLTESQCSLKSTLGMDGRICIDPGC